MARIQHLAIYTRDPERLAAFYEQVFGMVEVSREADGKVPDAVRICLSDGYVNFAIVPSVSAEGLDHLGFTVDDVDESRNAALALGARRGRDAPSGPTTPGISHHQGFILDPTGTRIDLTRDGWSVSP